MLGFICLNRVYTNLFVFIHVHLNESTDSGPAGHDGQIGRTVYVCVGTQYIQQQESR